MKAKVIFIIFAIVLSSINTYAQNTGMSLSIFAESINKSCPQEVNGGLIRLLGFSYQNNVFESRMEMNMGDLFDLEKASAKPKESKELISLMLANMYKSQMSFMFDQIIKENAVYRMVLSSMYVDNKVTASYTSAELSEIFMKYGKMTSADRALMMQVRTINLQSPVIEDEYITMDKAELTDASLIYYDTLDDKLLGYSTLNDQEISSLKDGLIDALSQSPVKNNVINSCLNSFRTITYVFTLKYSRKQYKIVLGSKDLKEILK